MGAALLQYYMEVSLRGGAVFHIRPGEEVVTQKISYTTDPGIDPPFQYTTGQV